jgi:hypothetical protein
VSASSSSRPRASSARLRPALGLGAHRIDDRIRDARGTTDTVHEALRDVIVRARRTRLAQRDLEDLTPQSLDALRCQVGRSA